MSDALDTMSLHSFDRKMGLAAEAGGQTFGVVRDEAQAAIEAFDEKDERIRLDIRRGLEIRLVKKHDRCGVTWVLFGFEHLTSPYLTSLRTGRK